MNTSTRSGKVHEVRIYIKHKSVNFQEFESNIEIGKITKM